MGSLQYNGSSSNGDESENNLHSSIAIRLLVAAQSFNQVYTPLLCLFGALGNCLSVTVFCRTPTHRSLSASFYLSALAISDTGFLFNLLAVWLEDMGLHVITSPFVCPTVMYMGQVTCFLSVWFIVAFTMERFFAVCYPLTRPTVCTVARAKKVIFVLTLTALIGFSYVWVIARVLSYPIERSTVFTSPGGPMTSSTPISYEDGSTASEDSISAHLYNSSSSSDFPTTSPSSSLDYNSSWSTLPPVDYISVCSVREEHVYFSSIASHIDSVLTLILPFGIIAYLNVRISLCVWKLKDQRENLVAMAKVSRQNSRGTRGGTHVGFVYRASKRHTSCMLTSSSPNSQLTSTNLSLSPNINMSRAHLLLTTPCGVNSGSCGGGGDNTYNRASRTNLTVDFDMPSESFSSSSTSNHCCSDFSGRRGRTRCNKSKSNSNNNMRRIRKRRLNGSSHAAAEARVTKTLLLVSTVFLVLNLPAHAIRATNFIQSFWEIKIGNEALFACQLWANILFNANFSVNFLLYCVSGRNFRLSLISLFCKPKRDPKSKRSHAGSPNTYTYPPSPSTKRDFYPVSVTEVETYA